MMGLWALCVHVANFVWPAWFVALVLILAVGARAGAGWVPLLQARWRHRFLWLWALGVAVLLGGLLLLGRDGKVATYGGLVRAQGSLAWWWRQRVQ